MNFLNFARSSNETLIRVSARYGIYSQDKTIVTSLAGSSGSADWSTGESKAAADWPTNNSIVKKQELL